MTSGCIDIKRISANQLIGLLRNPGNFNKILIVDCRSQKEYEGGHIKGAVNYQFDSIGQLYDNYYDPKTCFVFHCEYSQCRGPNALKEFVRICEEKNCETIPTCFVLDRGYKGFHLTHQSYTEGGYCPEHQQNAMGFF